METFLIVGTIREHATDIWWKEARGAPKHPTMHRNSHPTHTPTKIIWFNMTIAQELRNLGLEASRWLSWNKGGEWVLPPGLMQKEAEWRSCGWETARKHRASAGWEWDGVQWSGEYLEKWLSFLNNVSSRDTDICYLWGGVNFVPVRSKGTCGQNMYCLLVLTIYFQARMRK